MLLGTTTAWDEKDEINVPMALSVFRDGDRSPRSGGNGTYLITVEQPRTAMRDPFIFRSVVTARSYF